MRLTPYIIVFTVEMVTSKNYLQKPTAGGGSVAADDNAKKSAGPSAVSMGIPTDVKPAVKHVLSREQQLYYEKMVEAIIGTEEKLRAVAIESLGNDPGLQQLLPYFARFIAEKVHIM